MLTEAQAGQTILQYVSTLVERAQVSAEAPTTNKRNKALLKDMAVALVGLCTRISDMEKAAESRIVVPR